ncbi:LysM peptidoglycan-binding domain-containing protein [Nocardioides daphniae]|uniref:LysM domain-containing protein n=1 Tax=Nocardioides daphniae TaxID=402297 RepID=A0A4P7UE80_9ACTN|nr:LysM domain-containing protein [Nocardioides daphniae]QCC77831.1 hypothetical protein E2C04_12745 [Nocardioides daphniae]
MPPGLGRRHRSPGHRHPAGLESAATLRGGQADRAFDLVLVDLAGALAALVCPWLWILTSAGVADALRGRTTARAGWWRRLTLVACGCAASVALGSTAHAVAAPTDVLTADTSSGASGPGAVELLQGLPYPDRPAVGADLGQTSDEGATARPTAQVTDPPQLRPTASRGADASRDSDARRTHVVRSGDTLWEIARSHLEGAAGVPAPPVSDAAVARAVAALHQTNRDVVGADPT